MESEDGNLILQTLEHSYEFRPDSTSVSTSYFPKIPSGTYLCVRGEHQLEGMAQPFETFEVTNVPGHTNILIHPGNFNKDSEGCILIGLSRDGDKDILQSRAAFEAFMDFQKGVDSFTLKLE